MPPSDATIQYPGSTEIVIGVDRAESPLLLVTVTSAANVPDRWKRCETVGVDVVWLVPSPKVHTNFVSVAAPPDWSAPACDGRASSVVSSGAGPVVGAATSEAVGPVRTAMFTVADAVSPL